MWSLMSGSGVSFARASRDPEPYDRGFQRANPTVISSA